jgi:aminoglycoside phosphotransferase (APT) family kinase protein
VPESLEHGDLWAANVIATERGPVFLDWEDVAIAHPFITPSLLVLSVDEAPALTDATAPRRRIRDAYLKVWAENGPLATWPGERLERAFDVAKQVAMLHYAVQFRLDLATVETSREVRGFAPFFLRRLLG